MTNSHVISGCDSINVTLDTGMEYAAFVVGDDVYSDIAVLKIDAEDLCAASLGDSDQVQVGQPAIAIGNPTGYLQGTTTFGIISGVDRNMLVNNTVMNLLQTDAAINTGNSGGPLLNQSGQVIGINSAKISISGYEGLGFAIPINTARPIAEELVRNGSVTSRPVLGVACHRLSSMASSFYGLPQGLYVTGVAPGSGAAAAGLQAGDVITHINDTLVENLSSAVRLRDKLSAGDTISVTIFRRGMVVITEITLSNRQMVLSDYNL
jgi:serine protease Do